MKTDFFSREINITDKSKVIFIIGMYPGKQRKKDNNYQVFHGNKTGDFIEYLIRGKENLYLTNIFNYYIDEKLNLINDKNDIINKGIEKLQNDIDNYQPIRIILLGNFTKKYFENVNFNYDFQINQVFCLKHPSFILRFGKSKKYYEENFRKLLNH